MERSLRPRSALRLPRFGLSLPRMRAPRRVASAIALAAGAFTYLRARTAAGVAYVTVPVIRTDLSQTVTATGTVNPQNTIAIGSQDSGIDEIDTHFIARVRKG